MTTRLKDHAIAAWQQEAAKREYERSMQKENDRKKRIRQLAESIKRIVPDLDLDSVQAEVHELDGVRFMLGNNGPYSWQYVLCVVLTCEECGADYASSPVVSLVDVGYQLSKKDAPPDHLQTDEHLAATGMKRVSVVPQPQTSSERLANALVDFLHEHGYVVRYGEE